MAQTGRPRKDSRPPEEVMRAAGLEPLEPYPGTGKPWRCLHVACQREVTPRLGNVAQGSSGCIHCFGRARIDPDTAAAAMRAADLKPLEPYPGSDAAWRCIHVPCQREVAPRYSSIRRGGGPCLHCGKAAPVTAAQAVAEMRAAGMEPQTPFEGLDSRWPSLCHACGALGAPRLGSIRRGQGGCVPCGKKRGRPRNDAEQATAAMLNAGLEPLEPYPGTAHPWKCRCTRCGSIVSPRLGSLAPNRRRHGCKPCADRANGIAQRHDEDLAVAEMRAMSLEPQEPYAGIKYPWRCLCRGCGSITSPTFGSILAGQSGCRRCADIRSAAARREDPNQAAASMRKAGFEPLEPYETCMTPRHCRCTACGRISTPTLSKIRSGRGCKYCARHGFDRAAPARVYVVVHTALNAVKIGVAGANQRNDRLRQHARHGLTLYYEHHVPVGDVALTIEQTILRQLRAGGHSAFLTARQLPNGWSETFQRRSGARRGTAPNDPRGSRRRGRAPHAVLTDGRSGRRGSASRGCARCARSQRVDHLGA